MLYLASHTAVGFRIAAVAMRRTAFAKRRPLARYALSASSVGADLLPAARRIVAAAPGTLAAEAAVDARTAAEARARAAVAELRAQAVDPVAAAAVDADDKGKGSSAWNPDGGQGRSGGRPGRRYCIRDVLRQQAIGLSEDEDKRNPIRHHGYEEDQLAGF